LHKLDISIGPLKQYLKFEVHEKVEMLLVRNMQNENNTQLKTLQSL